MRESPGQWRPTFLLSGAIVAGLVLVGFPATALAGQQSQDIQATRGAVSGFGGFAAAQGDGIDSGPTFGGSGRFFFHSNVGVEGAVHYDSLDLEPTTANELSGGTLDTVSVMAGVVARFPASPRVAPYVAGGVTYFSTSFDLDPAVISELADFNFAPEEDIDSTVGFSVGGGVDALLSRRFGVFGDVRYVGGNADTTAQLRDTISGTTSAPLTGEQELHRITVTAGVRVFF